MSSGFEGIEVTNASVLNILGISRDEGQVMSKSSGCQQAISQG